MKEQFQRTAMLLGEEGIEKLNQARVAVFGIGGVGGYCVEALARAGIGALDLIDNDIVCESNLNRQIIATYKTIGRAKVDVAKERVESINPDCIVNAVQAFVLTETNPENDAVRLRVCGPGAACCSPEAAFADKSDASGYSLKIISEGGPGAAVCSPMILSDGEAKKECIIELDLSAYDYVVDAIDTVSGKLAIIETAKRAGVPVISCMGTGNKMDPSELCVTDLFQTSVCPLAKVMRHECRKRGIEELKVVYSTEPARKPFMMESPEATSPGSISTEETRSPEIISSGSISTEETELTGITSPENILTEEAGSPEPSASDSGRNKTQLSNISMEKTSPLELSDQEPRRKKIPPGSNSFVPPAAGLLLASEIIKDLIK